MGCSEAPHVLSLCLFVILYTNDSTYVNRIHTVEVAGSNPAAPTILLFSLSVYKTFHNFKRF